MGMFCKYKTIIVFFCFCLFSVAAPAQKTTVPGKTAPAAQNRNQLILRSSNDSLQYALGAYMGGYILTAGFLSIDLDYFMAGLEDVFNRRPGLLKDSTINNLLVNYQQKTQKSRSKDLEERLFASLKDKPGVGRLPSGVQYLVVRQAKGPKPSETDSVKIHFRQKLADGTVVEDTYAKNAPANTTPASLMPGLNEILQLMPVGSLWQVFIPSGQAYGEKGNGPIPPNAALQFELELLEIKK